MPMGFPERPEFSASVDRFLLAPIRSALAHWYRIEYRPTIIKGGIILVSTQLRFYTSFGVDATTPSALPGGRRDA